MEGSARELVLSLLQLLNTAVTCSDLTYIRTDRQKSTPCLVKILVIIMSLLVSLLEDVIYFKTSFLLVHCSTRDFPCQVERSWSHDLQTKLFFFFLNTDILVSL